jgi:hypothetical protein
VQWLGRRAFLVLALAPAAALVWVLVHSGEVAAAGAWSEQRPGRPTAQSGRSACGRPAPASLELLLGAWRALRQTDHKLVLAFGTVSQLGFLLVLVSAGTRE